MPYLILFLVAPLVIRVLGVLGIGYIVFVGAPDFLSGLQSQVESQFGQLPSEIVAILNILGVDSCITIIFIAVGIKLTLRGVDGVIKRFGFLAQVGS